MGWKNVVDAVCDVAQSTVTEEKAFLTPLRPETATLQPLEGSKAQVTVHGSVPRAAHSTPSDTGSGLVSPRSLFGSGLTSAHSSGSSEPTPASGAGVPRASRVPELWLDHSTSTDMKSSSTSDLGSPDSGDCVKCVGYEGTGAGRGTVASAGTVTVTGSIPKVRTGAGGSARQRIGGPVQRSLGPVLNSVGTGEHTTTTVTREAEGRSSPSQVAVETPFGHPDLQGHSEKGVSKSKQVDDGEGYVCQGGSDGGRLGGSLGGYHGEAPDRGVSESGPSDIVVEGLEPKREAIPKVKSTKKRSKTGGANKQGGPRKVKPSVTQVERQGLASSAALDRAKTLGRPKSSRAVGTAPLDYSGPYITVRKIVSDRRLGAADRVRTVARVSETAKSKSLPPTRARPLGVGKGKKTGAEAGTSGQKRGGGPQTAEGAEGSRKGRSAATRDAKAALHRPSRTLTAMSLRGEARSGSGMNRMKSMNNMTRGTPRVPRPAPLSMLPGSVTSRWTSPAKGSRTPTASVPKANLVDSLAAPVCHNEEAAVRQSGSKVPHTPEPNAGAGPDFKTDCPGAASSSSFLGLDVQDWRPPRSLRSVSAPRHRPQGTVPDAPEPRMPLAAVGRAVSGGASPVSLLGEPVALEEERIRPSKGSTGEEQFTNSQGCLHNELFALKNKEEEAASPSLKGRRARSMSMGAALKHRPGSRSSVPLPALKEAGRVPRCERAEEAKELFAALPQPQRMVRRTSVSLDSIDSPDSSFVLPEVPKSSDPARPGAGGLPSAAKRRALTGLLSRLHEEGADTNGKRSSGVAQGEEDSPVNGSAASASSGGSLFVVGGELTASASQESTDLPHCQSTASLSVCAAAASKEQLSQSVWEAQLHLVEEQIEEDVAKGWRSWHKSFHTNWSSKAFNAVKSGTAMSVKIVSKVLLGWRLKRDRRSQ